MMARLVAGWFAITCLVGDEPAPDAEVADEVRAAYAQFVERVVPEEVAVPIVDGLEVETRLAARAVEIERPVVRLAEGFELVEVGGAHGVSNVAQIVARGPWSVAHARKRATDHGPRSTSST